MYSKLHEPRAWLLTSALAEMAARSPDAPWLSDREGASLTFGEALSHSLRAAGWFERLGVARAERVGVFLFNGCAFATAWLGLGHLAATAVFFNTELRASFLRHQIADSGVRCIVVDAELFAALAEIGGELPALRTVVVVGDAPGVPTPSGWNVVHWPDWREVPGWTGPGPEPEDIACVMYTSGTSGPSKGVLMPHAHCALYGIGAIECLQLTAQDRYYICLPLFHANGLLMQLGATLLAGIPAFVRRRFSASAWMADIHAQRATVTNLLGAIVGFVLAQPAAPHDRDHALRALLCAPNLPQHEAQLRERFGVRDVLSGYGMTEVNIPIWGRLGRSVPGASGWTHEAHFEVRIADVETDEPVARGQVGEIQVRPKVAFGFMAGYLDAPERTVEAWRNLWFHTGDAGTMQDDGLVTFIDRIKDCIRRRGENISPAEVEQVVAALPGVGEVVAYAVPSDMPGGEDEIMLALVPAEGATLDLAAILRDAAVKLPRFSKPRYAKIVKELPKTATGKVQRAVLRKQGTAGAVDIEARTAA
ncbi:MAG: AMP-binding protein [Pseudomonadota bacterium]